MTRALRLATALTLTSIVASAVAACGKSKDTPAAGKHGGKLEYPVDVAPLALRQMQYTVDAPGTVEAFQQVQITARVAGAVDRVAFTEGQAVKVGDPLVTVESARYSIAVSQAKAAYAKAVATEKSAQAALDRRLEAQKESPGVVAGEEIEQKQTAVDTAKADVEAAKQDERVAELNLADSTIRAPIKGTVQTRTVQQGQYLSPGNVLATISERDPLLVHFNVSETDAPRLHPGMDATFVLRDTPYKFSAKLTLVSDSGDQTTRLTPVTAQVIDEPGHKFRLRSGSFCEVSVPVGNARQAIVVPSLAVQPTDKGNVVYIVDSNNIAHQRVVETGMHTSDGGVELMHGVTAGELIVVRGIDPLSDGAPVKINSTLTLEQASAPPPDAGIATPGAPMVGSATEPAPPMPAPAPALAGSAR